MYKRVGFFALTAAVVVPLTLAHLGAGEASVETKVVADGLTHPSGIAVHPKTGDLYVSDSGGARVIRVTAAGKVSEVVTGFKLDLYGKGPKYFIGPLGVGFLDADTMIVGGGDLKDGQELCRVYKLPTGDKALTVDDAYATFGPVPGGDISKDGEGNFYGIAISDKGVYITSNGDDTKGWILKIGLPVKEGKNQKLEPFIATKKFIEEINAPGGITLNKTGQLVVGQMGAVNKPKDSWYTVYDASGKGLIKAETGLYDITGLAYSPKTGKLYCTDFAWFSPKDGGVFRLDVTEKDGKATVTPVKIVGLEKPTALAFAPDGTLYVTVNGAANVDVKEKTGKVVKIAPGL